MVIEVRSPWRDLDQGKLPVRKGLQECHGIESRLKEQMGEHFTRCPFTWRIRTLEVRVDPAKLGSQISVRGVHLIPQILSRARVSH
jgi:hypothetical protein